MPENRPYTFELAAIVLTAQRSGEDVTDLYDTAQRNGVDTGQLQRAAQILDQLDAAGEDIDEWIRREYLLDGWLRGYIPIGQADVPLSIATQMAEAHYAGA
ncbi:hypothetical protein ACWDTP_12160 [Mycobacterium sp. NPDC003449]